MQQIKNNSAIEKYLIVYTFEADQKNICYSVPECPFNDTRASSMQTTNVYYAKLLTYSFKQKIRLDNRVHATHTTLCPITNSANFEYSGITFSAVRYLRHKISVISISFTAARFSLLIYFIIASKVVSDVNVTP